MNTDTLKGKWNQLKGDLKSKWGQITDDEFTQIAGDKDKLIGKIQERYGRKKEEAACEVNEFFQRHEKATTANFGMRDQNQNPNQKTDDRNRKIS